MAGTRLKIRPWMLKKEILILYFAFRDKRMGLLSKIPAILSVVYLVSPIDLIPDFIPFVGYVDDLVVVPLLLNVAIRMLPADLRQECLAKAGRNEKKARWLLVLLIIVALAFLLGIFFLLRHLLTS